MLRVATVRPCTAATLAGKLPVPPKAVHVAAQEGQMSRVHRRRHVDPRSYTNVNS